MQGLSVATVALTALCIAVSVANVALMFRRAKG
jgi:hypothetical protein